MSSRTKFDVTLNLVKTKAVIGMAVYGVRAVLRGKGRDVWAMVKENV